MKKDYSRVENILTSKLNEMIEKTEKKERSTIYKTYKDKIDWFKTTENEMISRVEGNGYYAKGTSLQVLQDVGRIETDFAIYSLTKG